MNASTRETPNQLRKHLRSLRGISVIRLRPVAIRDVRSFTLTDPSPSGGCLCKTVADKRGDPRDRSVMEPLDASKTSVTHRGWCRTGYDWMVASGVLLSERKDGIEKRPEISRIEIESPPRKDRYYFAREKSVCFGI